MPAIKPYYEQHVLRVSGQLNAARADLRFAVVTDTHLDNSLQETISNIRAVDERAPFDFLVHLGDFMNGSLPRRHTQSILKEQMELFRSALSKDAFYPVQGNHDGFCDPAHGPNDLALDDDWHETTAFLDGQVCREGNDPYYYIDVPEAKVRLIFLCSFFTVWDDQGRPRKAFGIDDGQLDWLKGKALDLKAGWTVLLFSHDTPFAQFSEDKILMDNPRINGGAVMKALTDARTTRGIEIAAWLVGHFHGDLVQTLMGIPFVLVASETAYVPQLWDMPDGGYYPERILDSDSEDLWDAVCLDCSSKTLRLFRCGAGMDREIHYGESEAK